MTEDYGVYPAAKQNILAVQQNKKSNESTRTQKKITKKRPVIETAKNDSLQKIKPNINPIEKNTTEDFSKQKEQEMEKLNLNDVYNFKENIDEIESNINQLEKNINEHCNQETQEDLKNLRFKVAFNFKEKIDEIALTMNKELINKIDEINIASANKDNLKQIKTEKLIIRLNICNSNLLSLSNKIDEYITDKKILKKFTDDKNSKKLEENAEQKIEKIQETPQTSRAEGFIDAYNNTESTESTVTQSIIEAATQAISTVKNVSKNVVDQVTAIIDAIDEPTEAQPNILQPLTTIRPWQPLTQQEIDKANEIERLQSLPHLEDQIENAKLKDQHTLSNKTDRADKLENHLFTLENSSKYLAEGSRESEPFHLEPINKTFDLETANKLSLKRLRTVNMTQSINENSATRTVDELIYSGNQSIVQPAIKIKKSTDAQTGHFVKKIENSVLKDSEELLDAQFAEHKKSMKLKYIKSETENILKKVKKYTNYYFDNNETFNTNDIYHLNLLSKEIEQINEKIKEELYNQKNNTETDLLDSYRREEIKMNECSIKVNEKIMKINENAIQKQEENKNLITDTPIEHAEFKYEKQNINNTNTHNQENSSFLLEEFENYMKNISENKNNELTKLETQNNGSSETDNEDTQQIEQDIQENDFLQLDATSSAEETEEETEEETAAGAAEEELAVQNHESAEINNEDNKKIEQDIQKNDFPQPDEKHKTLLHKVLKEMMAIVQKICDLMPGIQTNTTAVSKGGSTSQHGIFHEYQEQQQPSKKNTNSELPTITITPPH